MTGVPPADARWMGQALWLAERGLGRTTPNPAVGALVIAAGGVVVGHGSTEPAGGRHAEIVALDAAGARANGSTLYCTLEPCAHTGRTGPCVDRIIAAGVRRVVAAVEDPDPRVRGGGFARLRAAGLDVSVGAGRREAVRLNLPFFTVHLKGRPMVVAKTATSLDGRVASEPGRRTSLTSPPALRRAQFTRARMDAVAVGSATLLVDDPRLDVRDLYRERPLVRAVFDRSLRTPPSARLLSTCGAGPVVVLTSDAAARRSPAAVEALTGAGATVLTEPEPSVTGFLRRLLAFDVQSVLLEGGPALQAAAFHEGVVDIVQAWVAPVWLGEAGVPGADALLRALPALSEARVEMHGPDALIEGYVHRID